MKEASPKFVCATVISPGCGISGGLSAISTASSPPPGTLPRSAESMERGAIVLPASSACKPAGLSTDVAGFAASAAATLAACGAEAGFAASICTGAAASTAGLAAALTGAEGSGLSSACASAFAGCGATTGAVGCMKAGVAGCAAAGASIGCNCGSVFGSIAAGVAGGSRSPLFERLTAGYSTWRVERPVSASSTFHA